MHGSNRELQSRNLPNRMDSRVGATAGDDRSSHTHCPFDRFFDSLLNGNRIQLILPTSVTRPIVSDRQSKSARRHVASVSPTLGGSGGDIGMKRHVVARLIVDLIRFVGDTELKEVTSDRDGRNILVAFDGRSQPQFAR